MAFVSAKFTDIRMRTENGIPTMARVNVDVTDDVKGVISFGFKLSADQCAEVLAAQNKKTALKAICKPIVQSRYNEWVNAPTVEETSFDPPTDLTSFA